MIFKIKKIYLTHDEPNDLNVKSVWVIELGERIKQNVKNATKKA